MPSTFTYLLHYYAINIHNLDSQRFTIPKLSTLDLTAPKRYHTILKACHPSPTRNVHFHHHSQLLAGCANAAMETGASRGEFCGAPAARPNRGRLPDERIY